jgi:beta-mannosidase
VQWVENEDWIYESYFNLNESLLSRKHFEIQFDGLDTYADVYLNDSLILHADNMFRRWSVDITSVIRRSAQDSSNHLRIHFFSSIKKGKELAVQLPYTLAGDADGKVFVRKAQYQYGWDWGTTVGNCRHLEINQTPGMGQYYYT